MFGTNGKCPVYVVDDDRRLRQHLVQLLRMGDYAPTPYSSEQDFTDSIGFLDSGIALIELRLMHAPMDLFSRRRDISVIVTSENGDIPTAVRMIQQGAIDFLEKPFTDAMLLKALTNARTLLKERAAAQERRASAEAHLQSLTKRELDVMRALSVSRSNQIVADQLNLSIRTVEMHRGRIMKKFGATRFADVLRRIFEAGLENSNGAGR
ncbi:response regulator transcription factor [Sphingobium sp.]|uniref:response regulator transcription factor n=1 Tax=Sphingobium sp. TaxID=1912891 RepID=UPI0035C6E212